LITIAPDGPGFWKVELVNPKPEVVEHLKKAKPPSETDVIRWDLFSRLLQRTWRRSRIFTK
jgi:hypothetical protein